MSRDLRSEFSEWLHAQVYALCAMPNTLLVYPPSRCTALVPRGCVALTCWNRLPQRYLNKRASRAIVQGMRCKKGFDHAMLRADLTVWLTLPLIGVQDADGDDAQGTKYLELRDCLCGNTLSRWRETTTEVPGQTESTAVL